MKRTKQYAEPSGFAVLRRPDGSEVELPVAQGILKHLDADGLARLFENPDVALKHTVEALRIAPRSVLRHFPRAWLLEYLPKVRLREGRARALRFMHGADGPAA